MIVATTIICVMYNAIRITDVSRSQLQSSGRKLGLKTLNKEDKNTLVCLVAKSLLDYVKIVPGKSRNPTRNDIIKLKPFSLSGLTQINKEIASFHHVEFYSVLQIQYDVPISHTW